jgi:hypothetical protein
VALLARSPAPPWRLPGTNTMTGNDPRGRDVRSNTLTGTDVNEGSFGTVPGATRAGTANAARLANIAGAPGPPLDSARRQPRGASAVS